MEVTCKNGEVVVEEMETTDIESVPSFVIPDMTYRGRPCFNINKKELRMVSRREAPPARVKNYVDAFGTSNVYMRYGTGLTFKYDAMFPGMKPKK